MRHPQYGFGFFDANDAANRYLLQEGAVIPNLVINDMKPSGHIFGHYTNVINDRQSCIILRKSAIAINNAIVVTSLNRSDMINATDNVKYH